VYLISKSLRSVADQFDCILEANEKESHGEKEIPVTKTNNFIDKQKQDWIQNYIDVNNDEQKGDQFGGVGSGGGSGGGYDDEKSIMADYVISGNASSNGSDEHETCASSDIEVLSIPSLHSSNNIQQVANENPNKQTRPAVVIVKSPPATQQQEQAIDTKDNSDFKAILEQREMQIIKLNKQNVGIQETNDNLVAEIQRLHTELQQKTTNSNYDEITRKYAQSQLDKENLRKLNEKLNDELNNARRTLSEKCEQVEQLIQEGSKLSKQEMNQLSMIKKLRAKEKETEELITSLRNDYKKSEKELEELKKILDSKEESEKLNYGNWQLYV
jgi:hypothetical protein